MTRKKKLILNTITSFSYQFLTVIVGFILPRYYISCYGSNVNGLQNSIIHFLGFVMILDSGVGAVVQSTLYKPLADHDEEQISKIMISAERFFKKIAVILIIYVIVLISLYPFSVKNEFSYAYTALLIVVIAISTFAQYYFCVTYRFLLAADQKAYILYTIDGIAIIINTVLVVILIKLRTQIHFVRLITSIIYVGQVACLRFYVSRHYNLNKKLVLSTEPIKQKWNGFAQHIASVVLTNTDTVVLTLFSTLSSVSIYAIYHMIINGVKIIVNALTSGIQALFGNMLAKQEMKKLDETFSYIEWLLHTIVTLVFTMTGILIIPFVQIYTKGITDANYVVPIFAIIITIAQGIYCIRLPYNMIVLAAGHYKETQLSSIIEASLNIAISVATVIKFGLVGVAIGTLIAMLYRTIYLAWYLKYHILRRDIIIFLKHILVDFICVSLIVFITSKQRLSSLTFTCWGIMAIKTGIISLLVGVAVNLIFYYSNIKQLCLSVKNKTKA